MPFDDPPLSATEQIHYAILKRWVKDAWESNASFDVDDHFHPECLVTGMTPGVLEGVAQVRVAHSTICARMQHVSAKVASLIVRGDRFAGFIDIEAHHLDSDVDVAFEVSSFGRMRDGLIYRCHNVIDYTGLYAKLGVLDVELLRERFG
ncbi:nuclear transport factor 2 family protein [Planctomycetes bacterium K23_9]|uniref:SnoaL-like polyketide cyclase n=1 Tax=Stieleria marina TaxID=1930275 RepID=A0A517NVE6_9BACT|nr:SnoaL-like polyketide cyclase [Planctomycetes bacterium K23_9]